MYIWPYVTDRGYLFRVAVLALLYFITGAVSIAIGDHHYIITLAIFAAEGFSLAAVLLFGRSMWLGVFIGQILLAIYQEVPLAPAMVVGIFNSLEVVLVWHAARLVKLDIRLQTLRDYFKLVLLIVFVAQPFSAFFNVTSLLLFSAVSMAEYFQTMLVWWFGNTMGQLLWTPTLLMLYTYRKKIHIGWYGLMLTSTALLAYLVFFVLRIEQLSLILLLFLSLTITVAIRWGMMLASLIIVIISLAAITAAHDQIGIFAGSSSMDNLIAMNFFILAHVLLVFSIGILFHENKRHKQALEALTRTLHRQVEEEVEKRQKQTLLMAQQTRLASMGEMLSMIAHQWRQPLNRINVNMAVIELMMEEGEKEEGMIRQKMESIKEQTRFMSDTIEDFADYFRPDKKKHTFVVQKTVAKAVELLDNRLHDIEIVISPKDDIRVEAYEKELLQVLLSIFTNAANHFDAMKVEKRKMKITVKETAAYVTVTICDNGGGIDKAYLPHIFEPYFTTNNAQKGTGLGLYMARMLIEESMGGELRAVNNEEGACFILSLPKGENDV
jgi:signal transduction histidine kinase